MQERSELRKPVVERRPALAGTVNRSAGGATAVSPAQALQRRLGNQGTQALLSRSLAVPAAVSVAAPPSIQFARISQPSDPAELEAERIARKVVQMGEPAARPAGAPGATLGSPIIQRASAVSAAAPAAATVPAIPGGGSPLPSSVRNFMEPRLGANFSNVRIHTGESAAQQSAQLNAHAFTVGEHVFFGRNQFQPQSAGGRELIAHELTHTVQQGAVVQRSQDTTVSQRTPVMVQRLSIGDALDWIADKAKYIPGFRLLTIVLGVNPINMAPVDRSAANLLRALLELIPVIGPLIVQALDSYGIVAKVGAWFEVKVKALGLVGSALKGALTKFLDSLSWSDIFDLGGVWDRAKSIFTEPIDRLLNFGRSVASDIIGFVRQAILLPLAKLAEGTRGYDLLKAVLGEDPVTGQPVPRTAETLIGGFMKLIGQEEVWENIKKSNAIPRAWAWFQGALSSLIGFLKQIPTLFMNALKSLEIIDLVLPWKAFAKIAGVFGGFVLQFVSWAGHAVWNLLEIIFEAVSPGALVYLKKTGAALKSIFKNPVPFARNLANAAKLGFRNFTGNFLKHLMAGLIDWLTGSLPGIYIPKQLTLAEVAKFAFSVLGLTWVNIRQKLVKVIGEPIVSKMETGVSIIRTLLADWPASVWVMIKDKLTNLKDVVLGAITDFVIEVVVGKAIPKLIVLFVPGVGLIAAIISIYDTIKAFVQKISKLVEVVKAFVDSIVAIAAGEIASAAARIENALAGLLTLTINVLAAFFLGNVTEKVKAIIEKIRAPIDKALDWLVNWIVTAAKKLYSTAKAGVASVVDWWKEKLGFTNKAGESHTLQFIGSDDSAQMGIATSLTPVRQYLDDYKDKSSAEWKTADSVFSATMKVIYTTAFKKQDEIDRRAAIKQELAKVSAAFAKLGGEPPTEYDYGENTKPSYDNPAKVDVIVGKPLQGIEKTPPWPETSPGYQEIHKAGLRTATDKWVKMHIISAALGGKGNDFKNLIPAPQSINLGPFKTFERATVALVGAKSGDVKNRVWVEVTVSGLKHAATAISGKAGLYFWKGKKASPKWLKNEAPSFTASAAIPVPQLSGPRKLVLNFTSKMEMRKDFGIDEATAKLVYQGRPYGSEADFIKTMTANGATLAQVNAVLARKPVLNGP